LTLELPGKFPGDSAGLQGATSAREPTSASTGGLAGAIFIRNTLPLHEDESLIPELRARFNQRFTAADYTSLLALLEKRCGTRVEYRVAETPVFLPLPLLERMAADGAELAQTLMGNPAYLAAARQAIPAGYRLAGETAHPHFLTADFALVQAAAGELAPRLVEIQAFPSVYGYQAVLCSS
jgi:hypothetical protein